MKYSLLYMKRIFRTIQPPTILSIRYSFRRRSRVLSASGLSGLLPLIISFFPRIFYITCRNLAVSGERSNFIKSGRITPEYLLL